MKFPTHLTSDVVNDFPNFHHDLDTGWRRTKYLSRGCHFVDSAINCQNNAEKRRDGSLSTTKISTCTHKLTSFCLYLWRYIYLCSHCMFLGCRQPDIISRLLKECRPESRCQHRHHWSGKESRAIFRHTCASCKIRIKQVKQLKQQGYSDLQKRARGSQRVHKLEYIVCLFKGDSKHLASIHTLPAVLNTRMPVIISDFVYRVNPGHVHLRRNTSKYGIYRSDQGESRIPGLLLPRLVGWKLGLAQK